MDAIQGASRLKPNITKVILQRTVIGLIIVVVVTGALYALINLGGTDILDTFNISVDANSILMYGIIGAFGLAILLFGLGILSIQGKVWNFYGDRVVIGASSVLYLNILRVTVEEQDLIAKMLDYGTMKIEATGTMPDHFTLEFVAKPRQVAETIQAAINRFRGVAQAQQQQANRINQIVNQE